MCPKGHIRLPAPRGQTKQFEPPRDDKTSSTTGPQAKLIARSAPRRSERAARVISPGAHQEFLEVISMTIVHIERPAGLDPGTFETFMPPPIGDLPRPTLGSVEAWAAPDGAVETGTWEA